MAPRKPNMNSYDLADGIAEVEEQAVEAVVKILSKTGKDTLIANQFHNTMRFYKKLAWNALDEKFDHALQNILPGQSPEKLESRREEAKQRIVQLLREVVHSEGWSRPRLAESNVKWEIPEKPLLIKRGLSLQKLELDKADIASGTYGSVSIFESENGDKVIGKISNNNRRDRQGGIVDDLAQELKAYQTIYDVVGPHPNLVNTYGIARVSNDNGETMRALIMDAVPGKTGEEIFDALYNSWNAGKISNEKYWGAIQFIGRRLLDVTEHISKAGVVHNDIKPENFLVNEKTGEPVLIDLGLWSEKDEKVERGTLGFQSPELEETLESENKQGVDERSDVFTVGASLLDGIENPHSGREPNEGLFKQDAYKNREGNVRRKKASYSAATAYTNFMNRVMERNKDFRVNSQEAKNLDFLNDSMLDETAAKKAIKEAIEYAGIEENKPEEERWKREKPQLHVSPEKKARTRKLIGEFANNPNLKVYVTLRNESKTDPELDSFLNSDGVNGLLDDVEQEIEGYAEEFLAKASWFDDVKRISEDVPKTAIKSGVDKNGVRLNKAEERKDKDYEVSVTLAKRALSSYATVEDLRHYADGAEAFLRDAGTLKGGIRDDNIYGKVQQVRESAAVARRMVEIDALDIADQISEVEEQVVNAIAEFMAKTEKNKLATAEFDNMVQFYMNHGLNTLDEKFERALHSISSEQSRENVESMRDEEKVHLIQSVYEYTIDMAEKKAVTDATRFLSNMGKKLTKPWLDNMASGYMNRMLQRHISSGWDAIDRRCEHALQNIRPGQSPEEFERTRDNAKARIIQSVYDHMIAMVEKQALDDAAAFFSKMGKKLATPEFDNIVQGYINRGLDALDEKFEYATRNILPGQSLEEFEKARDSAKARIVQTVYAYTIAMVEKKVVEDAMESLSKSDTPATQDLDNMAQSFMERGLNALDEKFELVMKNLSPGQSRNALERARDSAKESIVRTVYEHTIAVVEKQFVEDAAEFFSKKDTLTQSAFNKMVQDYITFGSYELDQRFEQAMQNIRPGQSPEEFERTRDNAKGRLIQSINDICSSNGWTLPRQEQSNLEWESSAGPLLIKRGLSLKQLKLDEPDIASGTFGSVSIFENENGDKLIGKISKNAMEDEQGNIVDDLAQELKAYQIIYAAVGPHPNLVNAYGIAQVPNNGEMKRTLLMDAVPGSTGQIAFDALHNSWKAGKISSEEYWGAIQFIGRRLLDVTEHISKAGVVHNDIKPENFLVNEKTGEPVLIDLGLWSEKDAKSGGQGTPVFMSPEAWDKKSVDERSDVFTVGSSLLAGIEGLREGVLREGKSVYPNDGLLKIEAFRDREGNMLREMASYSAETAYTRFMNSVMEKNPDDRVDSQEAKNLAFLKDSMLDEDAAKKIIRKTLSLASIEAQKPENEQWKQVQPEIVISEESRNNTQELLRAFRRNPNLADYAKLRNESKNDRVLASFLDNHLGDELLERVERDIARHAGRFITQASWFDAVKALLETVPQTAVKSGVDENGVRLKNTDKKTDQEYELSVKWARTKLSSYINVNDLRRYADEAEEFLRKAGTLKGKISNDNIYGQVQLVRENAEIARRMVEIVETDLSASTKPENGNIRNRDSELKRQLKRRR